jgi:hypothetical protein
MQMYQGYPTGQDRAPSSSWSQVPVSAHDSGAQPVARPSRLYQASPPPKRSPHDVVKWLVYAEGGDVVGPVSASQVARGIRAGRVPTDASIQAAGEVFWTGVLEEPAIIAALEAV